VTDRPRLLRVVSRALLGTWESVQVRGFRARISPSDARSVFQAVVQTKPKGMGMGLAICRSIAEAHHGQLWRHPRRFRLAHFSPHLAVGRAPKRALMENRTARRTAALTSACFYIAAVCAGRLRPSLVLRSGGFLLGDALLEKLRSTAVSGVFIMRI